MAFKLTKSASFRCNVTIEMQDEKGRTSKETVVATFKRPNEEQLKELGGKDHVDVVAEWLENLDGLLDDDGNAVPYEGEYRVAFLAIPPATFALSQAFLLAARAGRAKN